MRKGYFFKDSIMVQIYDHLLNDRWELSERYICLVNSKKAVIVTLSASSKDIKVVESNGAESLRVWVENQCKASNQTEYTKAFKEAHEAIYN